MRWCLVLALVGCSVGAPTGFSDGDRWTFPLVGPLENGLLLVPVTIHGHGPYVFAIDTDAPASIVDDEVVAQAELRTGEGPHLLDESDHNQPRFYAEVIDLKIGTLSIERRSAMVVKKGTYDIDGRRVHGVIGRDVIADSLVFGFDRDHGIGTLTILKGFKPPPDAIALKFQPLYSRAQAVEVNVLPRHLVTATIGGQRFAMHVDLGATASQLRDRSWARAQLAPSDLRAMLIDEVGTAREITKSGVAPVTLDKASTDHVLFATYDDRRWEEQDLEGSLGLSFFRPFDVTVNWDSSMLYLAPRKDVVGGVPARIGRWQSKTLTSCEHVGCAAVSLTDPLAGKPADQMPAKHPGVIVSFARDASAAATNLEVLVAVTPAEGKPPLQWLVANMPAGANRVITHLGGEYAGAKLGVVDASPFPRPCPAEGGCIDLLAPPDSVH
ncbi:MAG: hypothetical protein JWO36_216 [Myxococcales bacterium]|nr:hypothetical protein [Myxococcales bacterium]